MVEDLQTVKLKHVCQVLDKVAGNLSLNLAAYLEAEADRDLLVKAKQVLETTNAPGVTQETILTSTLSNPPVQTVQALCRFPTEQDPWP